MGGRVDSQRKPRNDRETGIAERPGELLCIALALSGGVATAHDSNRGALQQIESSMRIQHRRRIGDFKKRAWIRVIGERDDEMALYRGPIEGSPYRVVHPRAVQCIQRCATDERRQLRALACEHELRQAVFA